MKVISLPFVPLAISVPFTWRDVALANLTVTPASIVSVTPLITRTLPVTTYGLLDNAHVVSLLIRPLTSVPGPWAVAVGTALPNGKSKHSTRKITRRLNIFVLIVVSSYHSCAAIALP